MAMSNPKTTIPGILLVVGAIGYMLAHALSALSKAATEGGGFPGVIQSVMSDWPALIAALTGLGLIGAKDGAA